MPHLRRKKKSQEHTRFAGRRKMSKIPTVPEGWRKSALGSSAEVAPADLHVPILGQLAPAQLPLGDALEPGALEVVRLDAALRGRSLRSHGVRIQGDFAALLAE